MYTSYFGMKESPFGVAPDPKYVFWSQAHQEALAHLLYGVEERKGFILLTGEVGAGKTLLCRCLLDTLGEQVKTAFILNPVSSADQLLRRMIQDLGIRTNPRKKPLERLNAFLLKEYAEKRNCVVVIDEAQTLPVEVLEHLRLVSNLETESSKLIQIILVGQDELGDILDRHSMRQLRQRIAVSYHLSGLSAKDTEEYIRHRLRAASTGVPLEFAPGALRAIFRASRGNPRLVNILCDRALLAAYSAGRRNVDKKVVMKAAKDLRGASRDRHGWGVSRWITARWPRRLAWAFAACVGLATGILAGKMWGWP